MARLDQSEYIGKMIFYNKFGDVDRKVWKHMDKSKVARLMDKEAASFLSCMRFSF